MCAESMDIAARVNWMSSFSKVNLMGGRHYDLKWLFMVLFKGLVSRHQQHLAIQFMLLILDVSIKKMTQCKCMQV